MRVWGLSAECVHVPNSATTKASVPSTMPWRILKVMHITKWFLNRPRFTPARIVRPSDLGGKNLSARGRVFELYIRRELSLPDLTLCFLPIIPKREARSALAKREPLAQNPIRALLTVRCSTARLL